MKYLQAFAGLNALVIGDIMLDRYLYGSVNRISPEAPVPIFEWGNEETRLGGAANVALNIQSLGANPILLGVVGQDQGAEQLFDLLPRYLLPHNWLISSHERKTTIKTRVMAGNQQLLRIDQEQSDPIPHPLEIKMLQRLSDIFDSVDIQVVIFQDYDKGSLTPFIIEAVVKEAKQRRIPVAVDPKFRNFWHYKGVDLFKPNLKEVKDALKQPVALNAASLRAADALLRKKLAHHLTFITLSEHGAYVDDGTHGELVATQPRKVADVCGAGDTVISVAALALALGAGKGEIAELANLAGGQVVEKAGVATVELEQLKQELLQQQLGKIA